MSEPSRFPPLTDYHPPQAPLNVLFEDADLLILDKPSGLLSVPGKPPALLDCLESRAEAAFPTSRLVHRLDMDTSGVMAFALTLAAQKSLGQQFENRQVSKRYEAVVLGAISGDEGTIDWPLTSDWPNRPLQKVCHETGKPSVTRWRVLDRTAQSTRVALFPETGRTHQLRVHMKALGHPILGDRFYGDQSSAPRLLLHACELGLRHPGRGDQLSFVAPTPF